MSKLRFIFDFLFNILSYFIKRNPNWIVFGSWHGKYFIDNPRYIYEYLLKKNNNYKLIWIGEKSLLNEIPKKENTLFVVKNSLRSIYFLLKSKYMFTTGGSDDLFLFNVYRNAVIINCWHGVPVKKICADSMGYKTPNKSIFIKLIKKICGHPITYSYYVSCSKKNDHVFLSAFRDIGIKDNQILKSGYPRNEIFFNADKSDFGRIKEKYSNILNFPVEKRVIMYLPTYRAKNIFYESFFIEKHRIKLY